MRSRGAHLPPQPLRRLPADRARELLERAREHDAVLAARRLDRHVLVEHVVEHLLGWPGERIAPPAAATVVVLVALTRGVLDVLRALTDLERVLAAVARDEAVRRSRPPAGDAGHRVALADDVRVDRRRHEHLLPVEAAAVATVLAGAPRVGLVVAPELADREDRFVDLGGRADQVPRPCVPPPPPLPSP